MLLPARPRLRSLIAAAALGLSSGGCDPARATAPAARELTLHVAAFRVPCVGEGSFECLQVRPRADAPWELLYGEIDWFSHESGYEYSLRVSRRTVLDPPADGSSFAYRLLGVLRRVRQ